MGAAMPCKMERRKRARKLRETVTGENTNSRKKTKKACIVEAHESTRKRLEPTRPRNHEDHIAEKEFHSITHYNMVHKCISIASSNEDTRSKSGSG